MTCYVFFSHFYVILICGFNQYHGFKTSTISSSYRSIFRKYSTSTDILSYTISWVFVSLPQMSCFWLRACNFDLTHVFCSHMRNIQLYMYWTFDFFFDEWRNCSWLGLYLLYFCWVVSGQFFDENVRCQVAFNNNKWQSHKYYCITCRNGNKIAKTSNIKFKKHM